MTDGRIDVDTTNGKPYKIKLTGIAARRVRWVYTNATGTKVVSGWGSGL